MTAPHRPTGQDHLVQLLLPLYDNAGTPLAKALFDAVRSELAERFGGVTAFVRSPAVGIWEDDDGDVCRDDVVLLEVVTTSLDDAWWERYRRSLEQRFHQEEVMIRALPMQRL